MRFASNRLFVLVTALGTSLALAGGAGAESTATIDFDTDAAGNPIDAGTVINDLYAGFGVAFSWEAGVGDPLFCGSGAVPKADALVYAARPASSADDPTTDPNVISGCPETDGFATARNGMGYWVARFDAPVRAVCLDVLQRSSSANDTGELIALDIADGVIDTHTDRSEVCVSGDDDIWAVKFSGDSNVVGFDTMRIIYGPIRIDFDHLRGGSEIPNGVALNDLYADQGVLFSRTNGTTSCGAADTVYANASKPVDFGSFDNAVSACSAANSAAFSESGNGVVVASFFTDVIEVCVDSLPEAGGRALLRVRSASGEVLGTVYSDAVGVEEILCTGPVAGIRSVEFAGEGSKRAWFDDFAFEFGGATVNFDQDPQGGTIADDAVINDTYETLGVTFSRVGPGTSCGDGLQGEIYANSNTAGAVDFGSPPNTVSLCRINDAAFSESQNGLIEARFARLQDSVCVDMRPAQRNGWGVMRAYGDEGGELDAVESDPGAIESLCVVEDGIRSVEFSGFFQNRAYFDDLRFAAVPEPGSPLLQGAALALLALMSRARGRRS